MSLHNIKLNYADITQYKLLYAIPNSTEVYEEPVPRTKKVPHCAVEYEADEEDRNENECLY